MKKLCLCCIIMTVLLTGCTKNRDEKAITPPAITTPAETTPQSPALDGKDGDVSVQGIKRYDISADVTNDGENEVIRISVPEEAEGGVRNFTVDILKGERVIWNGSLTDHAGDTKSYWLAEKEGKKYILEYQCYFHQNSYNESYKLIELDASGNANVKEEKSYLADTNAGHLFGQEDVAGIADFYKSIKELLETGTILFDIDGNGSKYVFSESESKLLKYENAVINPVAGWLSDKYDDYTSDETVLDSVGRYQFEEKDTISDKLSKFRAAMQIIHESK